MRMVEGGGDFDIEHRKFKKNVALFWGGSAMSPGFLKAGAWVEWISECLGTYCSACFPGLKLQSNTKGSEMSCRWISCNI